MNEFSIELAAERIVDRRTREHFQEVLSSYIAGNTRSAMVMLWTVVVCDLVYKLQELRDVEGDEAAKDILDSIAMTQRNNPKSPSWEADLLELTSQRMMLLDPAEKTQLEQVQQLRHLSAHPVLGSADILYRPNRETTRACIRNALEAVLLKPALFSKRIVDVLLEDLETRRDSMPDEAAFRRYLEARFVPPGTPAAMEDAMFQRLWIVAFRATDPRADANRTINIRALKVLHQRRPAETRAHVEAHAAVYSRVSDGGPLRTLVRFLAQHPLLYAPLTAAAREPLTQLAESDLNALACAWFVSPDLKTHVTKIADALRLGHEAAIRTRGVASPSLEPAAWSQFIEMAREGGQLPAALEVGIDQYVRSRSFDQADIRFAQYVAPYVTEFNADNLLRLLNGIEENNQAWGRARSVSDHRQVLATAKEVLGVAFDSKRFPNLLRALG